MTVAQVQPVGDLHPVWRGNIPLLGAQLSVDAVPHTCHAAIRYQLTCMEKCILP